MADALEKELGYTIHELHLDDDVLRLVLADFASWKQRARTAEAALASLRLAVARYGECREEFPDDDDACAEWWDTLLRSAEDERRCLHCGGTGEGAIPVGGGDGACPVCQGEGRVKRAPGPRPPRPRP